MRARMRRAQRRPQRRRTRREPCATPGEGSQRRVFFGRGVQPHSALLVKQLDLQYVDAAAAVARILEDLVPRGRELDPRGAPCLAVGALISCFDEHGIRVGPGGAYFNEHRTRARGNNRPVRRRSWLTGTRARRDGRQMRVRLPGFAGCLDAGAGPVGVDLDIEEIRAAADGTVLDVTLAAPGRGIDFGRHACAAPGAGVGGIEEHGGQWARSLRAGING